MQCSHTGNKVRGGIPGEWHITEPSKHVERFIKYNKTITTRWKRVNRVEVTKHNRGGVISRPYLFHIKLMKYKAFKTACIKLKNG